MYRVERDDRKRDQFGEYRYCVYRRDKLIAYFWHDHRGDEFGLLRIDGRDAPMPFGRSTDFLEGGGPEPLRLTEGAIKHLDKLFGAN